MAAKRSTHLDDPPSASSDDDETEDEQEQQITTQKPIQQQSSSEEEEEDDEEEQSDSESESEEETPEPVKPPIEKPVIQNPSSKLAESSSEEESESESEDETKIETQTPPPVKTSIEKPKTLTPNSSSTFESESDIRSPTASDFAIIPSKKSIFETPEKKRHSVVPNLKDSKKIKVSNGDIDDEKKSASKRLWSDDDELQLLQGFIDYQLDIGNSPLSDMDGFYKFTMDLVNVSASKSQLYEKVRRLKKKFRVNSEKASANGEDPVFVKPHEQKLFEISKKIWGINGCETVGNVGGSTAAKSKMKPSKIKPSEIKPKMKVTEDVKDDVDMDQIEDFETLFPYWNAGLNSEVSTSLKFPAGVVALVKEHLSLIGEEKAREMNEKWEALFDDEAVLRKRRTALLSNIGK